MEMKVLIVGSGGREHALAWKLKQSPKVSQIYIAPGNPGTAEVGENVDVTSHDEILEWLKKHIVDLVVIGPDQYLADGLTDAIQDLHIPVFGPTKTAAQIEWSKSYAKQFMREEGIPTARYEVFTDSENARAYVRTQALPLVVKADGLAAGKGVTIVHTLAEADQAIQEILDDKAFGESGNQIVIEEYLKGLEISTHAFCDGEHAVMFPAAKDHKRIFDGDKGPNTGGMGTIAPVPSVTNEQLEAIKTQIVLPTLAGLRKRNRSFTGVLFPGIMLTNEGPKVIEFNARFGDPEVQSYMLLLASDLLDVLYACTTGKLSEIDIRWSKDSACCIVLATKGYPIKSEKGDEVTLPTMKSKETVIFHSGTARKRNKLVTTGGRALGVAARGKSLKEVLDIAYQTADQINFAGKQFRKDIGTSVL